MVPFTMWIIIYRGTHFSTGIYPAQWMKNAPFFLNSWTPFPRGWIGGSNGNNRGCSRWAFPVTMGPSRLPHSYFSSLRCCSGKTIRQLTLPHLSPHLHFTQTKTQWKGKTYSLPWVSEYLIAGAWNVSSMEQGLCLCYKFLFRRSFPTILGGVMFKLPTAEGESP